jgi:ubiquinone/menaquinone biosynthesis C-methylase UbiE
MIYTYLKDKLFGLFPLADAEKLRIKWSKNELKKIPKGKSIIDVGAGQMLFRQYCGHLKYTSQDIGEYRGLGDKKGLQTGRWDASGVDIISDINKIPVKKSSFDNVLCTAVLEHIPHPELAIKEISRILRKGGKLILDAPFCSQTHFSPYFFVTGFSPEWYSVILSKYGFKTIKVAPYGNYFDYLTVEILRIPLVARRYSFFGILSIFMYLFAIPLAVVFGIMSLASKGSEEQLCFGYHVLAKKI